jgi:hypothetical protein
MSFAHGRTITKKVYLIERSSIIEAAFPHIVHHAMCGHLVRICRVRKNGEHSAPTNAFL